MGIYERIRADAETKIRQYGRDAVVVIETGSSPSDDFGTFTKEPERITVKLLDLPVKDRQFSAETTELANAFFLLSGAPFQEYQPSPGDYVEVGGSSFRIIDINIVAPGGVVVLYKLAVAGS